MDDVIKIILWIIVGILVFTPLMLWYYNYHKKRALIRKEVKISLIKLLTDGIINSKIVDYKDFKDFIYGFENLEMLKLDFPYSLSQLVLNTKHELLKRELNTDYPKKIIDSIKKEIRKEIKETKLKDPFKNVPSLEKNLLIDIVEISQLKSNKVFTEKLYKLGELIIVKEETIKKAGRDNKESLKIAKQSKNLAIIFFIISLALAIYTLVK